MSRFYTIDIEKQSKGPNAVKLTFSVDKQSLENQYCGTYCLRSWGLDWLAEKLWKTYVMLTKVEEGFRCLKSELGLRPLFHQIDGRIDGHLFITLLAYHVMQSVLFQLKRQGVDICWQTLQEMMATHTRVTSSFKNAKGETVHVRSSTTAEPH